MTDTTVHPPELLAPAGSPEALDAAIAAGADAVYFGGASFNARINAANFDRENMRRAIEKCRCFGVKSNITFNTLIYGREFDAALSEIEFLYKCGADALIIADAGLAQAVKKRFPDIELHASTQMSAHSLDGVRFLAAHGFDRIVLARELDRESIRFICENSPVRIEIFIHGALCVSASGQCLFSSMVGSRSANRGECAQPCRLPYSGSYPLSLKDNCLAGNMRSVLSLGASSLKIEGRMKSPAYVYGVTSIYRRLIDGGRDAADEEMKELASLFSRSGFTDAYFNGRLGPHMNGIRTDADKSASAKAAPFSAVLPRRKVLLSAKIVSGMPASVTLTAPGRGTESVSVTVSGAVPETARTAPLSVQSAKKNLCRFGASYFDCDPDSADIVLGENLMLPVSKLNELRRNAVSALESALCPSRRIIDPDRAGDAADGASYTPNDIRFADSCCVRQPLDSPVGACAARGCALPYRATKSARFLFPENIPNSAPDYFEIIYLPLERFCPGSANGVILPPVITDREVPMVKKLLEKARELGAVHALIGNVGHIEYARCAGFVCHGDFRLNAANPRSVNFFLSAGLADIIPSPELSLVQLAGLSAPASSNAVIYGRIPLMLLEKCVIKQVSGCGVCREKKGLLIDRRGEKFPVFREFSHRNTVYNSRVTYMADRPRELSLYNVSGGHFIFTDESAEEAERVIEAYRLGAPPSVPVRRIAQKQRVPGASRPH